MTRSARWGAALAVALTALVNTPVFAADEAKASNAAAPFVVQQVTPSTIKDALLRDKREMVMVVVISPDCADCKDLPALLARQAQLHPDVEIVTADADDFKLPKDKLPIVAMFEPKIRFLFDFATATAPAYIEAGVHLTANNINDWMNAREHAARVELWDVHRYNRLSDASRRIMQKIESLYARGDDSRPARLRRARLELQVADCFAEMSALQKRVYAHMDADRKWAPPAPAKDGSD